MRTGVNQQFIISNNCGITELSAEICTGELTAVIDDYTGMVLFNNHLGETVYYINAPKMKDDQDRSVDCSYYELAEIESGKYRLTVNYSADIETASDNISYPLYLEMSINAFDNSESSIESRYVSSVAEERLFAGNNVKVGNIGETEIVREYVGITQLPDLSDDGVVLSVKLCADMYYTSYVDNNAEIIEGHTITDIFDINTLTWTNQPDYSSEKVLSVSKDTL